ncbi:small GTP-binding protein domain protein [Synechococcus sp. PCC 7502]|uniref:YcjF family protein n=1 Tax=Synechococcus sp. PCC 7502 TaxID=1173263 RepID=UPI00029F95B6|nr:GTP-binding protein [Synechococcus sp. PCC 7502]AFY73149.1 small GTP-binding protein domain protein [Synechococcus sp. PCC 7502]
MPNFPWWRSLIFLIGSGLTLGLVITLLDRLAAIYQFVAQYQPLLAVLVVLLLLALVVALGLVSWKYLGIFSRRSPKVVIPEVSTDKFEAATENLEAIQQQVNQIQDEVIKRSLLSQSQQLQTELETAEISVVIFGTGSAGKTSLVNALLGSQVGKVSAAMGTTEVGTVYSSVQISGRVSGQRIDLTLTITDTPGILEVGTAGTMRERMAKAVATTSDLLLFVVDNDLLKSEYELLKNLSAIGKRSLLVFNKIDLFTKSDQQIILDRLRERVQEFINPKDVVAIAANPKPITLESGEIITPIPILKPLLKRLVIVLDTEGDDLVADNILLQSQKLSTQAREVLNQQRQQAAEQIITKFQWLVVGVIFATPLPVVDLLATAAINAQMVVEIAKVYECELNINQGKELASSLAKTMASLGIIKGISQIVTSAISVTVVGYLLKSTVQGVTGAYLTHIAGKSFMEYFSANQNWGDGGISAVVERQFQLNRRDEFIKSFIKEAVQRLGKLES